MRQLAADEAGNDLSPRYRCSGVHKGGVRRGPGSSPLAWLLLHTRRSDYPRPTPPLATPRPALARVNGPRYRVRPADRAAHTQRLTSTTPTLRHHLVVLTGDVGRGRVTTRSN